MTRKSTWAILVMAAGLSLPLAACKDTKTLQENEQLKAQVDQLQKENATAADDLKAMTASRDALAKENETLKAQAKPRKSKHAAKSATRKHHRTRATP